MNQTTTHTTESQLTATNRTIEASNGVTYAYRRFGNAERDVPPLLFLQHFRGNLDGWDPAFVDRIAAGREVILLDNTGSAGPAASHPTPRPRWRMTRWRSSTPSACSTSTSSGSRSAGSSRRSSP